LVNFRGLRQAEVEHEAANVRARKADFGNRGVMAKINRHATFSRKAAPPSPIPAAGGRREASANAQ